MIKTLISEKGASFLEKISACGKPVQPQAGLGGTNPYKMSFILMNMPFIAINLFVHPIAIININYIDCLLIAYAHAMGRAHGMGNRQNQ